MKLSDLLMRIQNLPEDTVISFFDPVNGITETTNLMYKGGEVIIY